LVSSPKKRFVEVSLDFPIIPGRMKVMSELVKNGFKHFQERVLLMLLGDVFEVEDADSWPREVGGVDTFTPEMISKSFCGGEVG